MLTTATISIVSIPEWIVATLWRFLIQIYIRLTSHLDEKSVDSRQFETVDKHDSHSKESTTHDDADVTTIDNYNSLSPSNENKESDEFTHEILGNQIGQPSSTVQ